MNLQKCGLRKRFGLEFATRMGSKIQHVGLLEPALFKEKNSPRGGSLLSAIMLAVSAVPSLAQGLDPQTHIPQLQTTTTGLPDLPQPALNLPTLNNYASPQVPRTIRLPRRGNSISRRD